MSGKVRGKLSIKKKNKIKEKLEDDRCLLVKRIDGKYFEMEGISITKSIYDKKIIENRRAIKKILAKVNFKTRVIEEENNMEKRAIKEADQKAEKLSHFIKRKRVKVTLN